MYLGDWECVNDLLYFIAPESDTIFQQLTDSKGPVGDASKLFVHWRQWSKRYIQASICSVIIVACGVLHIVRLNYPTMNACSTPYTHGNRTGNQTGVW